jgi:hypothetical protein
MDTYGRVFAGWHEDESLRGPNVVCMDENGWMPLGRGVGSDGINALLADNKGGAYVGGPVAPYGKPILGLAHWDGSQWIDMGLGVGRIKAMASDNAGDIYAGGDFTGGIRDTAWGNVAWWNGSGWRHLDKGFNGMVSVLSVNENGCLYAGGGFDSAGIQPTLHIAQWNGVTWVPLGSGLGRKNSFSIIRSIVFNSQGNLFAAGDFDSAGGRSAARVAQWDGENWSPLRKGMRCTVNPSGNGSEATVYSLVFDKDGYLFAGGSFDSAGSAMAHNIARWDGIDWAPLGSGCNKAVRSMVLDKYGILHVGGIFDSVGGVFSPYYAMCKVFAPYVKSTRVGAMATAMKVENGRLRIRLAAACEVSTRLMTLSGREAYHSRMIMPAGDHVVGLKAPGLGRGVYIAYVHYGTESKMWRMIVER